MDKSELIRWNSQLNRMAPAGQIPRSRPSQGPNATCESTASSRQLIQILGLISWACRTTAPWSELSKQAVVQGLAVTRSREIDRSNPNQRMPAAQEKNAACPFRVAKMMARPVWHWLRTSED